MFFLWPCGKYPRWFCSSFAGHGFESTGAVTAVDKVARLHQESSRFALETCQLMQSPWEWTGQICRTYHCRIGSAAGKDCSVENEYIYFVACCSWRREKLEGATERHQLWTFSIEGATAVFTVWWCPHLAASLDHIDRPCHAQGSGRLPNDDFMSPSAKAMEFHLSLAEDSVQDTCSWKAQWSTSGRGDLQIMKKLGANAVIFSEDLPSVLCKRGFNIFQCNLKETSQRKRDWLFWTFCSSEGAALWEWSSRGRRLSKLWRWVANAQFFIRITSLSWMKQQRRALRLAVSPSAEGFATSKPWKTQVIPGMSDYPYTQMPDNCMQTDSFVDPCSCFRSWRCGLEKRTNDCKCISERTSIAILSSKINTRATCKMALSTKTGHIIQRSSQILKSWELSAVSPNLGNRIILFTFVDQGPS